MAAEEKGRRSITITKLCLPVEFRSEKAKREAENLTPNLKFRVKVEGEFI